MADINGIKVKWEAHKFDSQYYQELSGLMSMYEFNDELYSVLKDLRKSQDRGDMIIAIELIKDYVKKVMINSSIKIELDEPYEYTSKNNRLFLDYLKSVNDDSRYLLYSITDAIYNIRNDKFINDNHSLLMDLIKDRDQSNLIIAKYLILNGTGSL